ncbi:hypothetical protein XELAEV_18041526mg [Xenopus laevis]|uniref:Uncharacterized protein n=1 Tax=Xenopus laevis TaxID=8355 RepID=A0A974C2D3_XENLA|nr:hypothetical protein XELAEV_18041526mg [Xenopus laevis]
MDHCCLWLWTHGKTQSTIQERHGEEISQINTVGFNPLICSIQHSNPYTPPPVTARHPIIVSPAEACAWIHSAALSE